MLCKLKEWKTDTTHTSETSSAMNWEPGKEKMKKANTKGLRGRKTEEPWVWGKEERKGRRMCAKLRKVHDLLTVGAPFKLLFYNITKERDVICMADMWFLFGSTDKSNLNHNEPHIIPLIEEMSTFFSLFFPHNSQICIDWENVTQVLTCVIYHHFSYFLLLSVHNF